jgi:hypothetical protein
MKALWLVSFRPIGKSKINDFFQSVFVDSVKSLDFDITFSLTQFEEPNVKEFIEEKKIKNIFNNIPKNKLPEGKKYSNKTMLDNALEQFINDGNYEYLIYSTADIIVPNNLFKILSNIKSERFCALIYPNTHVINGKIKNNFWPHFGIDLIIFKLLKDDAKNFKKIIKNYNQYDWGINENFYISVADALNLQITNLYKFSNVLKFDNDFNAFVEDRTWQINSWKENQKYFLEFLKDNKLNRLYALGSYYFLLYKILRFKDLNMNLLLSYLIFYPYNLIKKIVYKFRQLFK